MSDKIMTVGAEPVEAASCRVCETAAAFTVRCGEEVASAVSAPAQRLDSVVVTVKAVARTAYVYCARAARRLLRFISVKAGAFTAVLESRVRAFLDSVFPKTGADILRQSAILII